MDLKKLISDLTLWFDGKKTYINAATLLIIPYLVASGYVNSELGALICGLIGLITGAGKYYADDNVSKLTDLGMSLKTKRNK